MERRQALGRLRGAREACLHAARRGRIDVPPHRPIDAGALRRTALHRGDFWQGFRPISTSRLAPFGGYAISRCLPDKGLSRRSLPPGGGYEPL